MAVEVKVSQAELSFQADFSEPAFDIFRDAASLNRRMFSKLSKFGLRLSDIKPERGNGSLADLHLRCSLFNFSVTINVRAERVEVNCFDKNVIGSKSFPDAVVEALEAVQTHVPSVPFRTYTWSLALHSLLTGVSQADFLAKFSAGRPEELGPSIGSGTVFYYGPDAERLMSSVTIDLSTLLRDHVFIRAQVVWDAQKATLRSLPDLAEKYAALVLERLGLEGTRE